MIEEIEKLLADQVGSRVMKQGQEIADILRLKSERGESFTEAEKKIIDLMMLVIGSAALIRNLFNTTKKEKE